MAKTKTKTKSKNIDVEEEETFEDSPESESYDLTKDLIRTLNKEFETRIAYNLGTELEAPTNIKFWISTGCRLLDYIISNRKNGGFPSGRVIELAGPPSCGKSHIAFQAAKSTQKMGGLVIYIDTENATSVEKLKEIGINVSKNFVYVDAHCTEDVFQIVETVVKKASGLTQKGKEIPILVVWDSVANTSPKAELEGQYEDQTMALQARVIAKGMRKIVGFLGEYNVTFLAINQLKHSLAFMGDPWFTPGGKAIPFASSVRIRITSSAPIKIDDTTVGIQAKAKTIKNKITYPDRKTTFAIKYGIGTDDTADIHDEIWAYCKKKGPIKVGNTLCKLEGSGAWKDFTCVDEESGDVIFEKKYQKTSFKNLLTDETYKPILDEMLDKVMIVGFSNEEVEDQGEISDESHDSEA